MSTPDSDKKSPIDALTPVSAALVEFQAEARIPTEHGSFTMKLFREQSTGREHIAMVMGDVKGSALVRVHSECMTGDVFGSLRCDCGPQLQFAMSEIGKKGSGVVVYLRQEGRGIGLGNKIRAYALQNDGKDTVEANTELGFLPDLRSYEIAAQILKDLRVRSVALYTNNPDKLRELAAAGVAVSERVPHWVSSHEWNSDYLAVKRAKLGHQT